MEILAFSTTPPTDLSRPGGTLLYHVVNPQTASWAENFAPIVLAMYPKRLNIKASQFREWVDVLGQSVDGSLDAERNPAGRLVDFYREISETGKGPRRLTSLRAERASQTLRDVGAVNEQWISRWMQQWGFNPEN